MSQIGAEAGSADVTDGRNVPWLQDVPSVGAWEAWGANVGDTFVLDGGNVERTRYNLETNDLALPEDYEELKTILLNAAAAEGN